MSVLARGSGQLGRIDEMTENAAQRLVEAKDKGWLGEVFGAGPRSWEIRSEMSFVGLRGSQTIGVMDSSTPSKVLP